MSTILEIKLDKKSALILYYSLIASDIPDSSRTGIVYSEIVRQLSEQGIHE